ncbi:MAG: DRTGG domain-containing protein [Pleomorphochaeta sp.]
MKLKDVIELSSGKILCGESHLEDEVDCAFASDMMSDVLTLLEDNILLITGLSNNQAVRTAVMSDIRNIVIARNKIPSKDMIDMANEFDIAIITTPYSMYRLSGLLYAKGLNHIY